MRIRPGLLSYPGSVTYYIQGIDRRREQVGVLPHRQPIATPTPDALPTVQPDRLNLAPASICPGRPAPDPVCPSFSAPVYAIGWQLWLLTAITDSCTYAKYMHPC